MEWNGGMEWECGMEYGIEYNISNSIEAAWTHVHIGKVGHMDTH